MDLYDKLDYKFKVKIGVLFCLAILIFLGLAILQNINLKDINAEHRCYTGPNVMMVPMNHENVTVVINMTEEKHKGFCMST